MSTQGHEVELKYLLRAPQRPPLPGGWSLVGAVEESILHDEYLDHDGRLAAIGLRLRRRRIAGRGGFYTLKGARKDATSQSESEALHDRIEIESSELFGSPIADAIVTATAAAHAEAIDLNRLATSLSLVQRRSAQRLARNGEECATLSVDEISAQRDDASARWNELEIEFDGGDGAARSRAAEFDALMRSGTQFEPSLLSKPERAELLLSR